MNNFLKNKKDILGMNARNLLYIKPNNKKSGFQFADNKLQTKKKLKLKEIPTPNVLATITSQRELKRFN